MNVHNLLIVPSVIVGSLLVAAARPDDTIPNNDAVLAIKRLP